MGYKIQFTENSLADLEIILDFIRSDNPEAADRFGQSLLNHVNLLQSLPRIGVPVAKKRGIRKLLHSPIRVYYRILEDSRLIEILEFSHAARKRPRL